MIKAVTVYCSSSPRVADVYLAAAASLGEAMARAGWTLVYGGNRIGSMGALADAVRAGGGKVIGVTPKVLVDKGIADTLCDELIVTDGMRERKAIMEARGDAFIALPGGLGTFEEIFEIIVGRLLGFHAKPIVLLNVAHYYDPLLAMIQHGVEEQFIKPNTQTLYRVTETVEATLDYLRDFEPAPLPATPSAVPVADALS